MANQPFERQAALFDRMHPEYGKGVREAVARSRGGAEQAAAEQFGASGADPDRRPWPPVFSRRRLRA